ncbi:NAD-dependent epimerase/dehydratase family protein [Myxococcota bacterium]|nr:NAD-dependent epimerase/dehydratase family protein [Myxococcota bacterium]
MAKILVTGGAGFLGGHLVGELIKRGDEVTSYGRHLPDSPIEGVRYLQGDIRDDRGVDAAVAGMDVVFHLVSNFRSAASDGEAESINVTGTEHVLQAALRHRVDRLVHTSTIGVHGSVREVPANERTAFNPGDAYQETKLRAEQRVWEIYRETGLPISVVRPISLLGPGDERMVKLFKLVKKRRFVIFGDGSPLFQPAYVDDVVAGFLLCMEKDEAVGEAFILGGDEYLPLNELVEMIAEECGVRPLGLHVPMAPMQWMASVCEAIFPPLGLEPPLHHRRLSFFQNHRAFCIDKARERLGFEPEVRLRDAIRRTLHWYEDHGWV